MDPAKIAATILDFLESEFPNDDVELTTETDLVSDWLVDSLSIVEIVLFLETQFGINVDRADVNGDVFANVASLSEFVAGRLGG